MARSVSTLIIRFVRSWPGCSWKEFIWDTFTKEQYLLDAVSFHWRSDVTVLLSLPRPTDSSSRQTPTRKARPGPTRLADNAYVTLLFHIQRA